MSSIDLTRSTWLSNTCNRMFDIYWTAKLLIKRLWRFIARNMHKCTVRFMRVKHSRSTIFGQYTFLFTLSENCWRVPLITLPIECHYLLGFLWLYLLLASFRQSPTAIENRRAPFVFRLSLALVFYSQPFYIAANAVNVEAMSLLSHWLTQFTKYLFTTFVT